MDLQSAEYSLRFTLPSISEGWLVIAVLKMRCKYLEKERYDGNSLVQNAIFNGRSERSSVDDEVNSNLWAAGED